VIRDVADEDKPTTALCIHVSCNIFSETTAGPISRSSVSVTLTVVNILFLFLHGQRCQKATSNAHYHLSALSVPWCKKALYKYSSFPFLSLPLPITRLGYMSSFRLSSGTNTLPKKLTLPTSFTMQHIWRWNG